MAPGLLCAVTDVGTLTSSDYASNPFSTHAGSLNFVTCHISTSACVLLTHKVTES